MKRALLFVWRHKKKALAAVTALGAALRWLL